MLYNKKTFAAERWFALYLSSRVENNHNFYASMVGYGYGYRTIMVGYGYITMITISPWLP